MQDLTLLVGPRLLAQDKSQSASVIARGVLIFVVVEMRMPLGRS
jgi:hypothetical protein